MGGKGWRGFSDGARSTGLEGEGADGEDGEDSEGWRSWSMRRACWDCITSFWARNGSMILDVVGVRQIDDRR